MEIGDEEYKRELDKYLKERRPKKFNSLFECMTWQIKTADEFKKNFLDKKRIGRANGAKKP